jgi:nicotinamidase/pyrazinamidase
MSKDYIGLDKDSIKGKKLLKKLMDKGRRLYREPGLEEKRKVFLKKIKKLPAQLKKAKTDYKFPVALSPKLSHLTESLKGKIAKRIAPKVLFMDIDTQHDFANKKGALYARDADKRINNFRKLTAFAKKNNILIVSSRDTHAKDDPEFKDFPPHCVVGTWGNRKLKGTLLKKHAVLTFKRVHSYHQLKAFAENFDQIIWEKDVIDVFTNPNISRLLEIVFPDTVYLYGLITEYCIKTAIEGLLKMGFSIVLIQDAIHAISPKEKNRLFTLWKKKGIKFTTTKLALRELSKQVK